MVSFNEISSKIQDTSKTGSVKKKLNPYKVEYFKNNNEGNQNLRCDSQIEYHNISLDDSHKRSKSYYDNPPKSKKSSKSQEQSMLINRGNSSQASYHLISEYLENPCRKSENSNYTCNGSRYANEGNNRQDSRSRGKREKVINYPANSFIKVPNMYVSK